MREITALKGPKSDARTPGSDVFTRSWRTHKRNGISVSRQQLEGTDGYNGQSGGKNGDNKGQLCGPYRTIALRYRAIMLGYSTLGCHLDRTE